MTTYSKYIPEKEIKPGYTYRVNARNFSFGVANINEFGIGFIGIRQKFAKLFLFEEIHWESDPNFGSVKPLFELEKCPVENFQERKDELFDYLQEIEKNYAN